MRISADPSTECIGSADGACAQPAIHRLKPVQLGSDWLTRSVA
jgi:hypothetical protein